MGKKSDFCGTMIFVILCLMEIVLGAYDIYSGYNYNKNDCKSNYVGAYSICLGINSIIFGFACLYFATDKSKRCENKACSENLLVSVIIGGLLIWGMTMVWNSNSAEHNCPAHIFNYIYYRTTITFFIIVAILAIGIIFASVLVCAFLTDLWAPAPKHNIDDKLKTELDMLEKQINAIQHMEKQIKDAGGQWPPTLHQYVRGVVLDMQSQSSSTV